MRCCEVALVGSADFKLGKWPSTRAIPDLFKTLAKSDTWATNQRRPGTSLHE